MMIDVGFGRPEAMAKAKPAVPQWHHAVYLSYPILSYHATAQT